MGKIIFGLVLSILNIIMIAYILHYYSMKQKCIFCNMFQYLLSKINIINGCDNKDSKRVPLSFMITSFITSILITIGLNRMDLTSWKTIVVAAIIIIISFILSLGLFVQLQKNFDFTLNIFSSTDFNDSICITYLLYGSLYVFLYELNFLKEIQAFPYIILIIITIFMMSVAFIFLIYRIGSDKIKITEDYKTDKKNMLLLMAIFIIIQLMIFTSIVMYINVDGKSLGKSCSCIKYDYDNRYEYTTNVFYYVVMTYTSVGYGDIYPKNIPMKMIACVISLCGFLSSVFFISTLCGMFQQKEDTSNQTGNGSSQAKAACTTPNVPANTSAPGTSNSSSKVPSADKSVT